MKDSDSEVKITDTSDNPSNDVREYSMEINGKYKITDVVEVKDPWRFYQHWKVHEGDEVVYIIQHVYFDGEKWSQTLDWDGKFKEEIALSATDDPETETVYRNSGNDDFRFW